MNLHNIIKEISLFRNLNEDQITFISSISTIEKYPIKSILYYESDVSNNFQFLINGLIKVYKVDKFGNEIWV